MIEFLILPLICTLGGGYFLLRNISYLRDESKLKIYLESSPKAKLWVQKFGLEKTILLSKKYFLPLGIIVASVLLVIGLWNLIKISSYYL